MMEPQLSFGYAKLKIEWAQQHIRILDELVYSFISRSPYEVNINKNDETGEYIFNVGLTEMMPAQIPLMMGDIVHNLRSSLDYLWNGIERSVNPHKTAKLNFPIHETSENLLDAVKKASGRWGIERIGALILEGVKSSKDGNFPLWALNKLDVRDKHNLLIPSVGVTELRNVKIIAGGTKLNFNNCRVRGNKPWALVNFGGIPAYFEENLETIVDIVFGHGQFFEDEPIIGSLVKMADATIEVFNLFVIAFPEPES